MSECSPLWIEQRRSFTADRASATFAKTKKKREKVKFSWLAGRDRHECDSLTVVRYLHIDGSWHGIAEAGWDASRKIGHPLLDMKRATARA